MTKNQALSFNYKSAKNAEILTMACPKCKPYEDWFTFKRWQAQSLFVRKGEHGIRLGILVEKNKKPEDPEAEIEQAFRTIPVFCRHQVH